MEHRSMEVRQVTLTAEDKLTEDAVIGVIREKGGVVLKCGDGRSVLFAGAASTIIDVERELSRRGPSKRIERTRIQEVGGAGNEAQRP